MASSTVYDINRHVLVFGGRRLQGFAEGTAISIKRDTELATKMIGVDGAGMFAVLHDKSATLEVTLMPNSDSGGYLSACAALGRSGIKPLSLEDLEGNLLATAAQAIVSAYPETTLEKDVSGRKWTIIMLECEFRPSNAAT